MRIDLDGQTAVVTGSTKGLGRAIATGLHESGATVVIHGRTEASVAALADAIGASRTIPVAGELGTVEGCEQFCTRVDEAVARVDILINNAGAYWDRNPCEITGEEWLASFRLNAMSGALLTEHWGSRMADRGYGRIVSISSESAVHVPGDKIDYGVSKLAQLGVANGYAKTFAGRGVCVNSVLVGPTEATGNDHIIAELLASGRAKSSGEAQVMISATRPPTLLGRWTTPEEIAAPVVFLASPAASAITGAAIRLDGGIIGTVL